MPKVTIHYEDGREDDILEGTDVYVSVYDRETESSREQCFMGCDVGIKLLAAHMNTMEQYSPGAIVVALLYAKILKERNEGVVSIGPLDGTPLTSDKIH